MRCTEFKDGSRLRIFQREDKLKCILHSPAATPPWYSRTITLEMFNQLEDNNHFQRRFTLVNGDTEEISLPFLGHRVSTFTNTSSKKATVSD